MARIHPFRRDIVQKQKRLTMRTADVGYPVRLLSFSLAWSFFRFDGESTLSPTAANSNRWAFEYRIEDCKV